MPEHQPGSVPQEAEGGNDYTALEHLRPDLLEAERNALSQVEQQSEVDRAHAEALGRDLAETKLVAARRSLDIAVSRLDEKTVDPEIPTAELVKLRSNATHKFERVQKLEFRADRAGQAAVDSHDRGQSRLADQSGTGATDEVLTP